ncbi:MAG: hypothetical protein JXL85_05290 [Bacilli bacterium]|nr:hypothetical protein [Bacilli bacterium]
MNKKQFLVFTLFVLSLSKLSSQIIPQMEFKNQPIVDILLVLADVTGRSIVADETVTGNASFHFTEMDALEALKAFLSAQHMYIRVIDGITHVSKIDIAEHSNQLYSIHADDIDPQLLLRRLSRFVSVTILYDPLPKTTVTIHSEALTVENLIKIIISRFPEYFLEIGDKSYYVRKEINNPAGKAVKKGNGIIVNQDQTYSIQFDQYRLKDALSEIMTLEGREYFSLLRGDVVLNSMYFTSKTFDEALHLLLEQAGADYSIRNDIIYIFDVQKKDLEKKLKDTTLVKIKYLPVQDLLTLFPHELSNSSFYKLDKINNTIILTGSSQEIDPVLDFIKKVDIPLQGEKYATFRLKYIKAKDFLALIPPRLFPITPILSSNEYVFVAAVLDDSKSEIERMISLLDTASVSVPVRLKYLKTEDFLKVLVPSVTKEEIVDSGYPGLIFYTGSMEKLDRFMLELSAMDKPVPQIRYDLLVIQSDIQDSTSYDLTLSGNPSGSDSALDSQNPFSIVGSFEDLFSVRFDILSEFGYLFANSIQLNMQNKKSKIYADTSLTGITGEEIKFQNTSTVRYRDYEVDEESGDYVSTGVTREVTSGFQITMNGWISGQDMITMSVSATISRLAESDSNDDDPPGTSERIVNTQLRTPNGVPVAITGLVQKSKTKSISKIPILGDIPFLGRLFQKSEDKEEETTFNIYIVPRLMLDVEQMNDLGFRMNALYTMVSNRY